MMIPGKCTTFLRQWFSKCNFDWGKCVTFRRVPFVSGQSLSGVENLWWLFGARWFPAMDKSLTFSPQWFFKCTARNLWLRQMCKILLKILCPGKLMHNKSGVRSPWGPCGAWWSPALVAGTSVLGWSGGIIIWTPPPPPGTKYGTFGPRIRPLCAQL